MEFLKGIVDFFLFLSINLILYFGVGVADSIIITTSISMLSGVVIYYASLILKPSI